MRAHLFLNLKIGHFYAFFLTFCLLNFSHLKAADNNNLKKSVTLEFRNAPLVDVINSIADSARINVVIAPSVVQSSNMVNVRLRNVTYEVGLRTVLKMFGLSSILENGILRIDTVASFEVERQLKEITKTNEIRTEPQRTMVWQVAFAKADEILPSLTKLTEDIKIIDQRFQIEADKRTNKLIITGNKQALQRAKTVLTELDKPKRQIQIQARVVEAATEVAKTLQTSLGTRLALDSARGYGVGLPFPNSLVTGLGGAGALGQASPGAGVANGPVQNGELAVSLSSINNLINLDMILKAYETESLAQLIAEPRIVVQDQESATLNESQSSSRFTFVNGAGGSASISSSLSLNVKPQLAGENVVQLEIQVSRTSPTSPNSSSASGTVSRSANTKVFLKNGETTVISGLYQTSRLKSKGQIPILGSLPLIGWMFRLNDELTKKTELLIMVTPRILNDDSPQVNQANGDIMAEASESPVSLNTATSSGLNSTVEADPAAANAAASEEVPAINSPASSENSSANGTK